ncbi:unnamed protein product [Rangifer tarandus platyrhynchus]|uniref:Uncharacterized protein n=2 Tax=Rangifer tarandus platyrhynchus TaxID=3082113 RepID=A0AC59ZNN2_RANTA|nr:unnamed protein product [Rangifer tarandus platyrhynchus]
MRASALVTPLGGAPNLFHFSTAVEPSPGAPKAPLLFSTQLRKSKSNSQLFSSFTCCLFYFMGTFYVTSPTQPKASMTEPMAHVASVLPIWKMLLKQLASSNGHHSYPY